MGLDKVEHSMRVEVPTLDHYRLHWTPGPGVRMGGMWVSGIVTDDSGQDYLGLRGLSDFVPGMTHTVSPFCGFRALQKSLVDDPPHLFAEYSNHDWFEPLTYDEDDGSATLAYPSGRLTRDEAGLHWYDADGRWELHGRTVSKIFTVHVPRQDGIEHEVYYRHELLKATGHVEGTPVEGYLHQDFCYGPPGMTYTQLPIARQLEGLWFSWIHEDADGQVGGGCFWSGRGGLDFQPGYVLVDGETTAHDDFDAKLTLTDGGLPEAMRIDVAGHRFDITFDSLAGPLHTKGYVHGTSLRRQPVRSWCWIEYAEVLLSPEILDATGQQFALAWAR
jgi:hypothetical protein